MERTLSVDDLKALLARRTDLTLLDVRPRPALEAAPRMIAGAIWRDSAAVRDWAHALPTARPVVAYCRDGHEASAAVVDQLRRLGLEAALLEGGLEGWKAAGGQLVPAPAGGRSGEAPTTPGTDAEVNEASEESFPASDPPSFTPLSGPGRPDRDPEQPG